MEGKAPRRDLSGLPQRRERGDGGVAAQVHLLRRSEVANVEALLPGTPRKGGLRVFQLPGQGTHQRLLRKWSLPQGDHPCLIAGKGAGGKGVRDIKAHMIPPYCSMV